MKKLLLALLLAVAQVKGAQPIGAGGVNLVPADFSTLSQVASLAGTNLIVVWIGGPTNVAMTFSNFLAQVGGGGGGSGTTINPTDNYIPARSNSTTFIDSPIKRESSSNVWSKNIQIGTVENYSPSSFFSGALTLNDSLSDAMFFDIYTGGTISNIDPVGFLLTMNNRKSPGGATTQDQQESWGMKVGTSLNSAALTMAGDLSTGTIAINADADSAVGSVNEIGLLGESRGNATNAIAVYGRARGSFVNGQTNIALFGNIEPNALNTQIAVLADAGVNSGSKPVLESAMVLADSRSTGYPLFVGRSTNGTRQFYVSSSSGYTGRGEKALSDGRDYQFLSQMGTIYTNAFLTNATATADNDLFTVPAGYRALIAAAALSTTNGSTTAAFEVKISGSYYIISQSPSISSTAPLSLSGVNGYIFDPGEIIAVKSYQTGLNGILAIQLFSTNYPLKTIKLTTVSAGTNTLYTAPSGKFATRPFILPVGNGPAGATQIRPMNTSGSSITYDYWLDSLFLQTQAVANVTTSGSGPANGAQMPVILPNQSVLINSPTNASGQFIFMTLYETSN